MTDPLPLLYLSSADIAALAPTALDAARAVEEVFALKTAGRTRMAPKTAVTLNETDAAQAMVGMIAEPAVAGVKWVGVVADNPARGLPNINGLIVINDARTGLPRAIMDAAWITAARTAACSGVTAARLARSDAACAGFIGCGLQALSHLDALRLARPGLRRVRYFGRGASSKATFSRRAAALGLVAEEAATPREAVEGMDIVISSVPPAPGFQSFLDPDWLAPHAFVSAVDLGRCWHQSNWRAAFARVITDDRAQSQALIAQGKLLDGGPFDGEIGEILTLSAPPAEGRSALLFAGSSLCDVALGAAIEARARALGIGTELAR